MGLGRDSRASSWGAGRFCVMASGLSCKALLDSTFALLAPLGCGGVGGRCFGSTLGLGLRFGGSGDGGDKTWVAWRVII